MCAAGLLARRGCVRDARIECSTHALSPSTEIPAELRDFLTELRGDSVQLSLRKAAVF